MQSKYCYLDTFKILTRLNKGQIIFENANKIMENWKGNSQEDKEFVVNYEVVMVILEFQDYSQHY